MKQRPRGILAEIVKEALMDVEREVVIDVSPVKILTN